MTASSNVFKKDRGMYISIGLYILEGLFAGGNFIVLYAVSKMLFESNIDFNQLLKLTAVVAAIFLGRLIVYATGYTGSQIEGAKLSKNIRVSLGNKLKRIPLNSFTQQQTGFYINGASTEVSSYEKILTHKVGDIIKYSVLVMMVILYVSRIYLPTGIVLFCTTALLVPTIYFSLRMVKIYGNRKNSMSAENTSSITEYTTGIQTMRAYGMGGKKNKTVTKAMKDISDVSYKYEAAIIPIANIYGILNWSSMPLIIMLAGNAWVNGSLAVSDLIILIMIPLFVCKLNTTLFVELTAYRNLMISKNNITEIIAEEEEKGEHKTFTPENYKIEFKDICFSYVKGEQVLNKVNFTAENGKLTAIIGDSGSGKSTIFNLLSKYYSPDSGDITIGNQTITCISSEQVLKHISIVEQDIFLFNDTIFNNIRYAKPDATDDEVKEACRLANCHTFIDNMENGYNTYVGENGNKLSGGERQRLSVARAILKDSPIVLLDEATSSLDIENELLVKEAIVNLLDKEKTVIIIAHTLSVIKNAHQILVVEKGRIVECENHEELLKINGKYKSMWEAELSLN